MVITHVGGYCFKLVSGETTVAVNPPSPKSSFKVSKFGADVVLISKSDPDWDGAETTTHGEKAAFVVRTPGSYEVGDVVVNGYATDEFENVLYTIEMDGMKVLVLGALATAKLPQDVREDLDDVEIVFVPVGDGTLDSKAAHELVTSLEPNLVIPYQVGRGDDLKQFLKAEGATDVKPVDKLTFRAKEVEAMDGEVALLD
jgi:L-ascorbate metabolism protein UlaG (beta-lactamase superfamily)